MIAGVKVEGRNRNLIFINVIITSIASSLLMTALNTALSPVCEDIGISVSTGQWLISGETLAIGITMPLTAFLIRRFRTRNLYLVGIVIFLAGLALAMVSQNFPTMMVGRVMQGCGNGILMSMAQVIILSIFPPEKRGTTMGIYGLAISASPVIAPTLGGVLVDAVGWRSIFLVDLIVMLVAFIMACFNFKNVLDTEETKLDLWSFILSILAFGGLTLGIGMLSNNGANNLIVWISFAVGIVGMIFLLIRQLRLAQPFLDFKILKVGAYAVAVISCMLINFTMMGSSVLMPLYVQNVLGRTATIAGLATLPGALAMAVLNPFAGRLYDRIGIKRLFVIGSAGMLVSNICMCLLTIDSPLALAIIFNLIRYSAIGFMFMPLITWGTTRVRAERLSDATALLNSFRTIAGSVGSAVFVGIMSTVGANSVATYGESAGMHGVTMAFVGMSISSVAVLLIAIFAVKGKRREKGNEGGEPTPAG